MSSTTSGTTPVTEVGQLLLPGTANGLQVSLSAPKSDLFPQGDETATLLSTVLGPPDDPAFAHTPLTVTVTLYNSAGTEVRILDPGSSLPHDHWRWNGRDATNTILPAGQYEATLVATALDQGVVVTGSTSVALSSNPDLATLPCQLGVGGGSAEAGRNPLSSQNWAAGMNTESGDYLLVAHDLTAPAQGIPLEWTRYYNSLCQGSSGPFGPRLDFHLL